MVYLYTFHFSLESQELGMTTLPSVSHVLVQTRVSVCVRAQTDIQDRAAFLSLLHLIDSTLVRFVAWLQSVCVGYFLSASSCVFMNAALVDSCCL